jgi:hypothetical protein
VLFGICCVLIASAATHSGAGRAAGPSPIAAARESIAGHIHDPSALFVTAAETRRILGHVDRVDLSYGVDGIDGIDFFATVFYKPFPGDLTGKLIINRLPDANPLALEKDCRAHGHKSRASRSGGPAPTTAPTTSPLATSGAGITASTPSTASTTAACDPLDCER